MTQYSYPGKYYDGLMATADHPAWARFARGAIDRFSRGETRTVLDLACGTGILTALLAEEGYDVTAVDASPEMLMQAAPKLTRFTDPSVLLVQGDMRDYELNDVVDCTVCALGSLNYLTGRGDLVKCFKNVALFSRPDALFLFDVDTPCKFRTVYGGRDYVLETDGVLCAWQNDFDEKRGTCDFYLSFFEELPDGRWLRTDEYERERMYTRRMIENALKAAGMELCGVFSGDRFDSFLPASDTDERWMVAARIIK